MPPDANFPAPVGSGLQKWSILTLIVLVCLALSTVLGQAPYAMGSALVAAVAVFIVCFVSTEASLYLLIFSMLLSPEIGMGDLTGPDSSTGGRGVTLRTEDFLLVVMCFSWLARMAVHKELGLVRQTPLNRPIAAYVAACVLATGMGLLLGHVEGSTGFFFVLKYVEYFVVYFIVANNVHSRVQIQRFTAALLLTAFIVGLVAVIQIPTGVRVAAPFEGEHGEPNTLGGYLLFTGAVAGGMLLSLPGRRVRRLLVGLLGVLIVPFFATLSRGSYLALPFTYLGLAILSPRRRVAMILIMVLFGVVGVAAMPKVVVDRITYTFNQGATSHARVTVGNVRLDSSTSARLNSWQEALTDAMDSPIWGYGVTGYQFLDAQYPRVLVETGLLGLVIFAILIGAVFRETFAFFRRTRDPLYRGLSMGLLAGLVGLLVHAVGANTFIIVRIMEPFWLTVGLVISAARIERSESAERAESGGDP